MDGYMDERLSEGRGRKSNNGSMAETHTESIKAIS